MTRAPRLAAATVAALVLTPLALVTAPAVLAAPAAHTVTVNESDNGKTVKVHEGDTVQLILHSTYWNVGDVDRPARLVKTGGPTFAPQPGGVPGSGRGTETVTYRAAHHGMATIKATRETCGEALRCTKKSDREYSVHIFIRR